MDNERTEAKIYNLRVAINETGINPDTLRAWERRYGLPKPDRSKGGHRRYSIEDIQTIQWLIERQDEGMSISSAVDLWENMQSEGVNPLQFDTLISEEEPLVHPPVSSERSSMDNLRQEWISAIKKFDETRAEQCLIRAFALFPPEEVCFEILSRGLSEIGKGWYEGDITIQQEHFATALAVRKLETLITATPPPIRRERLVAAMPTGENHEFSILFLTYLLRRRGWDIVYLGVDVPIIQFESLIAQVQPSLIISSAQLLHTAHSLRDLAEFSRSIGIPFAFGGGIFIRSSTLIKKIPGYYLGDSIKQAPEIVESIINGHASVITPSPVDRTFAEALNTYRDHLSMIEAKTAQRTNGIPHSDLTIANEQLAKDISAALTFGDFSLLGNEISWLENLMVNYRIPIMVLRQHIEAYHSAVLSEISSDGLLVAEWLENILSNWNELIKET